MRNSLIISVIAVVLAGLGLALLGGSLPITILSSVFGGGIGLAAAILASREARRGTSTDIPNVPNFIIISVVIAVVLAGLGLALLGRSLPITILSSVFGAGIGIAAVMMFARSRPRWSKPG